MSLTESHQSRATAAETSRHPSRAHRARPCQACGCRVRHALFDTNGYRYVECPGCGLAHLDPAPTEDEARANFPDGYFTGAIPGGYDDYLADEPLHRENARLRLELLDDTGTRPPGRLLDVGCAHGFFLDEARDAGWRVQGVEVCPGPAATARDRFGLDVAAELGDVSAHHPGTFDTVTLFQVLEHVASPVDVLRSAHACLRSSGALVVETWDRSSPVARVMRSHWQDVAPPSVVWLFDRTSLALLLESAGFRVTEMRHAAKRVSVRFVGSLLDDHGGALAPIGRAIRRSPLRDRSFLYRFGDLVTVVARPAQEAAAGAA